jgi:hypothetical protein
MHTGLLLNLLIIPHTAEIHGYIVDFILQGSQRRGRRRRFLSGFLSTSGKQQNNASQHADQPNKPFHTGSFIIRQKGIAGGIAPSAMPGGPQRCYFSISGRCVQDYHFVR